MNTRRSDEKRLSAALDALNAQLRWMDDHGRTLAGYIAHYGPTWDVAGIYRADDAKRAQLETVVNNLEQKIARTR
jgi:hypothetical protein